MKKLQQEKEIAEAKKAKEKLLYKENLTNKLELAALKVQIKIESTWPIDIGERKKRWDISITDFGNEVDWNNYEISSYGWEVDVFIKDNLVVFGWPWGHDLSIIDTTLSELSSSTLENIVRIANLINKADSMSREYKSKEGIFLSPEGKYGGRVIPRENRTLVSPETIESLWLNMKDFVNFINEKVAERIKMDEFERERIERARRRPIKAEK